MTLLIIFVFPKMELKITQLRCKPQLVRVRQNLDLTLLIIFVIPNRELKITIRDILFRWVFLYQGRGNFTCGTCDLRGKVAYGFLFVKTEVVVASSVQKSEGSQPSAPRASVCCATVFCFHFLFSISTLLIIFVVPNRELKIATLLISTTFLFFFIQNCDDIPDVYNRWRGKVAYDFLFVKTEVVVTSSVLKLEGLQPSAPRASYVHDTAVVRHNFFSFFGSCQMSRTLFCLLILSCIIHGIIRITSSV